MAVNPAAATTAPQITGAIQQAAKSSGISFQYLLTTAQIESNLNPIAQAATSSAKSSSRPGSAPLKRPGSARRLWRLCRRHYPQCGWPIRGRRSGPARGYHAAAQRSFGQRDDGRHLHARQCRPIAIGDRTSADRRRTLHRAFSWAGRSGQTDRHRERAAESECRRYVSAGAAANRSIFYDGAGRARSAAEVYAKLTGRFDAARANSFAPEPAAEQTSNAGPEFDVEFGRQAGFRTDLGFSRGCQTARCAVAIAGHRAAALYRHQTAGVAR